MRGHQPVATRAPKVCSLHAWSNSRSHRRDTGWLLARLGGVNAEPPIPLLDLDVTRAEPLDLTSCGIGARSGVDAVRAR
jgi:hypothetical protein